MSKDEMPEGYDWQQFAAELDEMTRRSTAQLAETANAKNVRRLVRGFKKQMSGQTNADNVAALISVVAEVIQHGASTPGEGITLMNTIFREIIAALSRPPPN